MHTVLVADNLTQECLLGVDFLSTYGCTVNLGRHILVAGGEEVELNDVRKHERESSFTCHVAVSETTIIPG